MKRSRKLNGHRKVCLGNAMERKRVHKEAFSVRLAEWFFMGEPDGTLYPTFCRPQFNERLTFAEFCRRAADELTQVASGFAIGLGEEK